MKVKVRLFGIFSERADTSKLLIENVSTKDELMDRIWAKYPDCKEMTHIVSVNQEIVNEDITLQDGDEVALMPPFAGG